MDTSDSLTVEDIRTDFSLPGELNPPLSNYSLLPSEVDTSILPLFQQCAVNEPPLVHPAPQDGITETIGRGEGTPVSPSSPSPKDSMTPGDFKLLKLLGKGCFGKVLQVMRKSDKKVLALKAMNKSHLEEQEVLSWVAQEQKILEHLAEAQNPFIVRLHHAFSTQALVVFVMDFLNGGDLNFHLKRARGGKFPVDRARFYFSEIALAIDFLHRECNIIYRDVKPENVILNSKGHAVLADFGFADFLPSNKQSTVFCGSPDYISPEMIHSDERPYSFEVDWWSMGVMLYELLTGACPWSHDSVPIQYDMICDDPLPPCESLTSDSWDLLCAMLHKNIEIRVRDLESMKSYLFFSKLNWDNLLGLKQTPPFIPVLTDCETKYFDAKYTEVEPKLSTTRKARTNGKNNINGKDRRRNKKKR